MHFSGGLDRHVHWFTFKLCGLEAKLYPRFVIDINMLRHTRNDTFIKRPSAGLKIKKQIWARLNVTDMRIKGNS